MKYNKTTIHTGGGGYRGSRNRKPKIKTANNRKPKIKTGKNRKPNLKMAKNRKPHLKLTKMVNCVTAVFPRSIKHDNQRNSHLVVWAWQRQTPFDHSLALSSLSTHVIGRDLWLSQNSTISIDMFIDMVLIATMAIFFHAEHSLPLSPSHWKCLQIHQS